MGFHEKTGKTEKRLLLNTQRGCDRISNPGLLVELLPLLHHRLSIYPQTMGKKGAMRRARKSATKKFRKRKANCDTKVEENRKKKGNLQSTEQAVRSSDDGNLPSSQGMQLSELIDQATQSTEGENLPSSQDTQFTEDTWYSEEEETPNDIEGTSFDPDDVRTWSEDMVSEMINSDTFDFFGFAVDGGILTDEQCDRMHAMDIEKLKGREQVLISHGIEIDRDFGGPTS